MKEYQGYRSWAAWNVSLWVHNDQSTYELALACRRRFKRVQPAARMMLRELGAKARTPDGATYNASNLTTALAAIERPEANQ